jgi:hypothetical protein
VVERKIQRWLPQAIGLFAMAACLGAAAKEPSTQTAPARGADSALLERVVAVMQRELDIYLMLPTDWQMAPDLRRGAQAVLDEAAPRLRSRLRQWALELAPVAMKAGPRGDLALELALGNRYVNEAALNLLDNAGPEHLAWRSRVAGTAGWCRHQLGSPLWGEVLFEIERLPEAERTAALDHERQVLARWGLPRPGLPDRPTFSLDAYAATLLARLRDGAPERRPPVAMVPVVAATLLADKAPPLAGSDTEAPPHRAVRCAALQWALANARAERRAAPEVLDNAFRHGRVQRLEDLPRPPEQTSSPQADALREMGYPPHVARRELTGLVRVEIVRDGTGRVAEARVVRRQLGAPGLQGRRPVAFETALDEASLVKARALRGTAAGTSTVDLVWKLEP